MIYQYDGYLDAKKIIQARTNGITNLTGKYY